MCDPASLALIVGGAAASGGGAYLTGQNAVDKANAANAVLAQSIGKLSDYGDKNKATFDANMTHYAPDAQGTQLADAQTSRGNTAAGNISTPDQAGANNIPISGDAPKAVKSEIAKRMLASYDGAVSRAKALGRYGGYNDTWFTNDLNNQGTARNIDFTNSLANEEKSLIQPRQQIAMYGTGNNRLGDILKGVGSIMGAAGGAGLGVGAGAAGTLDPTNLPNFPGLGYTFNGSMSS